MATETMAGWLARNGLGQYGQLFADSKIDLDILPSLSEQDLKELGLPLGDRKRLLAAMQASPATQSGPLSQTPMRASAQAEGERRQLTVLFCDMVGFTELASRVDPEVLQRIIQVYEDACAVCIIRYEGYVFQRLGDGIVAFFGYPLAHEGEAERAIHAGLAIIDALSRLEVPEVGHLQSRIGIATGVVVVSSAVKGAVGETMNLASRLQGIAPVGGIAVSDRVRRLAGGSFEYQDLGAQTLKGIAQPTHAHRILSVSQAASRFEAATQEQLTPMVGREQEIALLLERWALAQDGEGQVVLISGEPGIGKSRILRAIRERLEAQGAGTIRFQCSPYHVNSTFYPLIDNFERALKCSRDESPESKLDKLEALLVTQYGRPTADVRFIASMLSIPVEARYGALVMTPQKHKDETLRSLVDIVQAASRMRPTVMLFEDAHWADPTTLEALDLLVDRVSAMPLLIVFTHRPEFQSRWSQYGQVTAVHLSRLTRAQSHALVFKLTQGKPIPEGLLAQILARTDGVPLFVEELTRSILEAGELKETEHAYIYTSATRTIPIPATLRDSLMARLDRNAQVKEIAQIGAAIGREFSYELLAQVILRSQAELDSALSQLIHSGLAFRRGTPPEATYTFKHALVQDAAYDSLLMSRRQALHGEIARAIEERLPQIKETEPELLAHHLTAAGRTEQAIPLWQKAGELALKRMALPEAIAHLNTGLGLVGTLSASPERDTSELGLRTVLGTAWMALRGWAAPEVWSAFHPALSQAKSLCRNDAALPILYGLFWNVLTQGRVRESLPWAEQMLEIAQATNDADLLITGHTIEMGCYYWMGQLNKVIASAERIQALYSEDKHRHLADIINHDPKTLAGCFAANATWMLGFPDRAARLSDAKDTHARQRGHPFDLGFALTTGAETYDYRAEPEEMLRRAEECERVGHENSLPVLWALLAPGRAGVALIRAGKFADGIAPLKAGLDVWGAAGGKVHSPYFHAVLAQGMAHLGDVDGALHIIEEQIAQVERPGWEERIHYAEILRLKGWMLTLKNDFEGAEKNYLASLDWARHQQAKSWELRTATSLAKLWQTQGKHKAAYDLLAPVYHWFTEGFDTKDLKEAKLLLEELHQHV